MAEKETDRFVSLNRAKDVRVNNLESAKECLRMIKIYHELKAVRSEKKELIKDLEKEAKEFEVLFNKLYEFLPDHKIIEEKVRKKPAKKKNISKSKKTKPKKRKRKKKSNKEINKLERTLTKIEDKLNKI